MSDDLFDELDFQIHWYTGFRGWCRERVADAGWLLARHGFWLLPTWGAAVVEWAIGEPICPYCLNTADQHIVYYHDGGIDWDCPQGVAQ